jgi:hypothetical protein
MFRVRYEDSRWSETYGRRMRSMRSCRLIAATLAVLCMAGCGGKDAKKSAVVREGAVVYRDALDDDHGGWLRVNRLVTFRGGLYEWREVPPGGATAMADDAISGSIPEGIAISVRVDVLDGAALRGVTCRELGPRDQPPQDWYDLGIDGRRALIRRMQRRGAPKVLASTKASLANRRPVRVTGECVPDGDGGLLLILRLDGREVLRVRDKHPLPARRDGLAGTPAIFAYERPDSPGPATVTWDDFELRRAALVETTGG